MPGTAGRPVRQLGVPRHCRQERLAAGGLVRLVETRARQVSRRGTPSGSRARGRHAAPPAPDRDRWARPRYEPRSRRRPWRSTPGSLSGVTREPRPSPGSYSMSLTAPSSKSNRITCGRMRRRRRRLGFLYERSWQRLDRTGVFTAARSVPGFEKLGVMSAHHSPTRSACRPEAHLRVSYRSRCRRQPRLRHTSHGSALRHAPGCRCR